jgi:hypothetical protein
MINAVIAQLLRSSRPRLRVALVLVLALIMGGLPSHVASSHATTPESQSIVIDDVENHTHEEPDGAFKHGGHSHGQDAADHSHQFSLLADNEEPPLPDLSEGWQMTLQETFRGSARCDIDKPPKDQAAVA